MYLIPLLLGFILNCASAFTTFFSKRWGEKRGQLVSTLLRDVFGIPVWFLGFCLAMRTPSPQLFKTTLLTDSLAWSLVAAGAAVIFISLRVLGWRSAKPSVRDSLVAQGSYAHVRHPIHSGTFLEFLGLALWYPSQAVVIACALGTGWILLQTRLEEWDLLQRIPGYLEYMRRVPRFIPRFSKKQTR